MGMAAVPFLLPTGNSPCFVIAPIPMAVPRRFFLPAGQVCLRLVAGGIVSMAFQLPLPAGQFPGYGIAAVFMGMAISPFPLPAD